MRDIAFLVYPGYSLMALAVTAGFEVANSMVDPKPYDLRFVSENGGPVKTSAGMTLQTEMFTEKPFDTLVVGGATYPEPSTPGLIAFVRDAPKRHRRIASVCTGAFVLAAVALGGFLLVERRAPQPMVTLSMFRSRVFSGGTATMMLWGFGVFGIYFFTALYLQDILGFSPTKAGLAFVPMALAVVAFSGLAGPQGPSVPPEFADAPMARLVLYVNVEVIHHGAEICLLRDLYRRTAA